MHISEGILSGPVIAAGAILTAAGTMIGLKRLDYEKIARAGVLSAAFFVASLIHVPIGPANVHLVMSGLVGLFLGWVAFPVILTALILQALFFQFGGVTTLGVNTVIMALPALVVRYLFGRLIWKRPIVSQTAAFLSGFTAIFLGAVLIALTLYLTGEEFVEISGILVVAHLPVMVIEGVITLFAVVFIKKVQPDLLPAYKTQPPISKMEKKDA